VLFGFAEYHLERRMKSLPDPRPEPRDMSTYLHDLDHERLRSHVGIVIDGNGRWPSSAACDARRATTPARRPCGTRSSARTSSGCAG
jgi:hypothetical protein